MRRKMSMILAGMIVCTTLTAFGAQRHVMQPRVPEDQLPEARALRNPLSASAEVLERGKTLYQGKGTCFNCHGETGGGDGKAAVGLDPAPRNFRHHGFWRHRTEGEIFWVIKHGIPGTGMVGFGSVLTDDEIWSIIQYERSFAGKHRPGRGMDSEDTMGRMGPRRGMGRGGMGQHGPPAGMEPNERGCCPESEPAQ